MNKKLIWILGLVLCTYVGIAQPNQPWSVGPFQPIAKGVGTSGARPVDSKYMYYDAATFLARAFKDTTEVRLRYVPNQRYKGLTVLVNSDGSLSSGVITGGTNSEWWYKDGIADGNLVPKQVAGSSVTAGYGLAGSTTFRVDTTLITSPPRLAAELALVPNMYRADGTLPTGAVRSFVLPSTSVLRFTNVVGAVTYRHDIGKNGTAYERSIITRSSDSVFSELGTVGPNTRAIIGHTNMAGQSSLIVQGGIVRADASTITGSGGAMVVQPGLVSMGTSSPSKPIGSRIIVVPDSLSIGTEGPTYINGDAGLSGQVLKSQGSGLPWIWGAGGGGSSISLTTTGVTGASTYNSGTGILNIPNYQSIYGNDGTISSRRFVNGGNKMLAFGDGVGSSSNVDSFMIYSNSGFFAYANGLNVIKAASTGMFFQSANVNITVVDSLKLKGITNTADTSYKILVKDSRGNVYDRFSSSFGSSGTSGWALGGNAGIASGQNFIGTNDNKSFSIKTNNVNRLYVDSATGNVGIGTSSPGAQLEVANDLIIKDGSGSMRIAGGSTPSLQVYNSAGVIRNQMYTNVSSGDFVFDYAGKFILNNPVNSGNTVASLNSIGFFKLGGGNAIVRLDVDGDFRMNNGQQGAGKTIEGDANGVMSWVNKTAFVRNENYTSFTGTTITLSNTPSFGSVALYKNTARMYLGLDYTVSGGVITLTTPAISTDRFVTDYNY